MDSHNLAVVLAPNILYREVELHGKKSKADSRGYAADSEEGKMVSFAVGHHWSFNTSCD